MFRFVYIFCALPQLRDGLAKTHPAAERTVTWGHEIAFNLLLLLMRLWLTLAIEKSRFVVGAAHDDNRVLRKKSA